MLSRFPNALILATEDGYQNIPGVRALPIEKWRDIKDVVRQLDSKDAKETYKVIGIDTLDIAVDLCTKFICNQQGVSTLSDIPFGKGYGLVEKELDTVLRKIVRMGYGLVLISHSQDKTFTDPETTVEYSKIVPTLDKRSAKVANRLVDIIAYAHPRETETGEITTMLQLRGTPRITAGSRFPKDSLPDEIKFDYDSLVEAVNNAIDFIEKQVGSDLMVNEKEAKVEEKQESIEVLVDKFQDLANKAMTKDKAYFGPRIQKIVATNIGEGKKIANAQYGQEEMVQCALDELEALMKEYKK